MPHKNEARVPGAGLALLAGLVILTSAGPGQASSRAHAMTSSVTAGVWVGVPRLSAQLRNTGCCA